MDLELKDLAQTLNPKTLKTLNRVEGSRVGDAACEGSTTHGLACWVEGIGSDFFLRGLGLAIDCTFSVDSHMLFMDCLHTLNPKP